MQTVVTATDTYKFKELSEEIQEQVLNKLYDINTDHDWHEYTIECWKEKLEKIGFLDAKIYFSGFFSQGDGACFDADIEVNESVFDCFVEDISNNSRTAQLFNAILRHGSWFFDYLYNYCSFDIKTIGHHYSHEHTRKVRGSIDIDIQTSGYLEYCFDEFRDYLEELRRDLSQTIYFDLRREYEYLTSREAVTETIECNEYTFTKEGNIF